MLAVLLKQGLSLFGRFLITPANKYLHSCVAPSSDFCCRAAVITEDMLVSHDYVRRCRV